eukprot:TRINITY_DN14819_c0_g1_i1.p1 TRINITY_DN14819_c0_g1~~TRINITY_DN14819_c0_g1_i1.p1  ORF type:complete len:392 (+),score=96.25 TRINITY_DN14819_c0_g1_i1:131-1306(+)
MGKLRSYLRKVQKQLAVMEENICDVRDRDVSETMTDVVTSILRLSCGSPAELKQNIRAAILTATVQKVSEVLDPPEGDAQEEDDQEDGELTQEVAETEEKAAELDVSVGDEAGDLAGVVAKLWEFEESVRLVPGSDIVLCEGGRAASLDSGRDVCESPLFESVDEEKLMTPLTKAFVALLDNYVREGDQAETTTTGEQREMNRFLTLLSKTPHFQYVHNVLVSWGRADESMDDFLGDVFQAWFSIYRVGRRGPAATSGFEHVFVGEEKYDRRRKKSMITGMHNWIQFWNEERQGNINYLGYVGQNDDDDTVVSARFLWDDDDPESEAKSVSTFLVGTSIAFEFALGTLCFFGLDGDDPSAEIEIAGHSLKVQVYKWKTRMATHVRSVFLEG